jgi:hypothetical protein
MGGYNPMHTNTFQIAANTRWFWSSPGNITLRFGNAGTTPNGVRIACGGPRF